MFGLLLVFFNCPDIQLNCEQFYGGLRCAERTDVVEVHNYKKVSQGLFMRAQGANFSYIDLNNKSLYVVSTQNFTTQSLECNWE